MIATNTPESKTDDSGADAVREKVDRLLAERADLKERLRANTAAFRDAVAAGRLFGVEIAVPPDVRELPPVAQRIVAGLEPTMPQPSLFDSTGELTIRQAVLDQLRMAGKKGLKARALRRVIENMVGRQLHYKTIGMTLYRLATKGYVRREGIVWFFVKEPS